MPTPKKRMKDRIGIDLRIIARGKDSDRAEEARQELRRRVDNLRGAVIPAWELERRGPRPAEWELL